MKNSQWSASLQYVNSLAPAKRGNSFKSVNAKHMLRTKFMSVSFCKKSSHVNATKHLWWYINIVTDREITYYENRDWRNLYLTLEALKAVKWYVFKLYTGDILVIVNSVFSVPLFDPPLWFQFMSPVYSVLFDDVDQQQRAICCDFVYTHHVSIINENVVFYLFCFLVKYSFHPSAQARKYVVVHGIDF